MTSSGVSNASKRGLAISRPVMTGKAACYGNDSRCGDSIFNAFLILPSDIMGDDYISAYRYADKKIDNQTDDQSIATDGRQSLTAGKLSDNSNIY